MYRVFCKGLNSSFVAGVKENWAIVLVPVGVVDKVLLFERRVVGKIVMIHLCARKISRFVTRDLCEALEST